MPLFSVIVPVYNRPQELAELLDSIIATRETDLEIIVVEDGSQITSHNVIEERKDKIPVIYLVKQNTGQGFSRNFAAESAGGKYLLFVDSDCLLPIHFFAKIRERLNEGPLLFWGGPDAAHPSFTVLQKAISYTMTSMLTTGGIRGGKGGKSTFQPRTFNMGVERNLFLQYGGFHQTNMGEDIELSTRLIKSGINAELLSEAFVYHKRRNTFGSFFSQIIAFGRGRVINGRKNKGGIKLIHWFPTLFTLGLYISVLLPLSGELFTFIPLCFYSIYFAALFLHATLVNQNLLVGLMAVPVALAQMIAYGTGFLLEFLKPKK